MPPVLPSVDLARVEQLLDGGPPVLFATLCGEHQQGFPGPRDDLDIQGAMVLPLPALLGLVEPEDTRSIRDPGPPVVDLLTWDVRKFAKLIQRRNGYVLEQLYSPLPIRGGRWLEELREIGRGFVVRRLFHYYSAFAGNCRRLLADSEPTARRMLFCYRVPLTGIHLLRTGEVLANLPDLLVATGVDAPRARELIARRAADSPEALGADEIAAHAAALDALAARLVEAFDDSALPDEPKDASALDDFVIRARLSLGIDDALRTRIGGG